MSISQKLAEKYGKIVERHSFKYDTFWRKYAEALFELNIPELPPKARSPLLDFDPPFL